MTQQNFTSQNFKNLSQTALPATTLTDIYTCPNGYMAKIQTISICNRGGTDATFRLSLAKFNDTTDNVKQYRYYDVTIPANDTVDYGSQEWVISMWAGDIIRAYASNGNISVALDGYEYN